VAPVAVGDLDLEIVKPVADAARIAQGVCEPLRRDPGATPGPLFQLAGVAVQPVMNMLAQAQLHQRLGCHGAMVGQVSIEFGAGAVQPLVGLVEHSCAVEIGCLHQAIPSPVKRFIIATVNQQTTSSALEHKSRHIGRLPT